MSRVRAVLAWPGLHLQKIGIAAFVGALVLLANALWQPIVVPHMPAELSMSSQSEDVAVGMLEESSLDFIFRPLFLTSRQPMERVVAEPVVEAEPLTATVAAEALEGYQLLGVFSSGSAGGVILLDDANERSRLFVGEALQGWVLDRTDLRSAHFRSDAGATAALELAVASTLPLPKVAAVSAQTPVQGSRAEGGAATGQAKTESEPVYDGPVTFESIGARQKREMESRAKAQGAKP